MPLALPSVRESPIGRMLELARKLYPLLQMARVVTEESKGVMRGAEARLMKATWKTTNISTMMRFPPMKKLATSKAKPPIDRKRNSP